MFIKQPIFSVVFILWLILFLFQISTFPRPLLLILKMSTYTFNRWWQFFVDMANSTTSTSMNSVNGWPTMTQVPLASRTNLRFLNTVARWNQLFAQSRILIQLASFEIDPILSHFLGLSEKGHSQHCGIQPLLPHRQLAANLQSRSSLFESKSTTLCQADSLSWRKFPIWRPARSRALFVRSYPQQQRLRIYFLLESNGLAKLRRQEQDFGKLCHVVAMWRWHL